MKNCIKCKKSYKKIYIKAGLCEFCYEDEMLQLIDVYNECKKIYRKVFDEKILSYQEYQDLYLKKMDIIKRKRKKIKIDKYCASRFVNYEDDLFNNGHRMLLIEPLQKENIKNLEGYCKKELAIWTEKLNSKPNAVEGMYYTILIKFYYDIFKILEAANLSTVILDMSERDLYLAYKIHRSCIPTDNDIELPAFDSYRYCDLTPSEFVEKVINNIFLQAKDNDGVQVIYDFRNIRKW